MKVLFFVSSFLVLAASGCSVDSNLKSAFDGFDKGGEQKAVTATYLSDCQPAGSSMSYRIKIVEQTGGDLSVSQRTYTESGACVGYEIPEAPVETNKMSLVKMGDLVAVTFDGQTVETRLADHRQFEHEVGVYVQYAGSVKSGDTTKPISYFVQIVGRSPYSGNYPYLWAYRNGFEIHPRSNPWVSSGVRTSRDYESRMANCNRVEEIVVAAGKFRACAVEIQPGETVWYGNVSLDGIVKYEKKDGVISNTYGVDSYPKSVGLPDTSSVSFELSQFAN